MESGIASDNNKEIFDSAFLGKLERLQLVVRRIFHGRHHGLRKSRRTGTSLEFADYRDYSAGDDLRSIDWNLYGRLDRLFLKLYEEEQELHVHILVDDSPSMHWPKDGQKAAQARRIAAALAYIALANLDHVDIHLFGDSLQSGMGQTRGKDQFAKVLQFLRQQPTVAGQTDFDQSFKQFGTRVRRRALVILISDFFNSSGFENGLRYFLHRKFGLEVVRIMHPLELAPEWRGDMTLVDSESGEERDLVVDERMLREYQRQLDAQNNQIAGFCQRHGASFTLAGSDLPFEDVILKRLRTEGGMVR